MATPSRKETAVDDKRLAVEVVTAIPGETRLVMRGDVDIAADEVLATAYAAAAGSGATRVVLDFGAVEYINSTGIALIVRLLAEARRDRREVVAVALTDHYREIFRITRLSDYLTIADPASDADARPIPEEAAR
jgi:anti-sigma B factor antagonist